jgi:hypothetical protein
VKGTLQIGIRAIGTLQIGIRAIRFFDTEPRWASGAVFGLRMQGEIESGGPISDPGLLQSVKEILDEFLSSGGLAVL